MHAEWDDLPEADAALSKHEFSRVTGLAPREIDALVRAGMPATPGPTSRAGFTFNLKAAIRWMADDQRTDDPLTVARQRKALAEAERLEIQNQKIAGSLVDADIVKSEIARNVAEWRSALLQIPLRLTAQSPEVREAVGKEIEATINARAAAFEKIGREP